MFSRLDLGTQLTQAVSRDTAEMISKKPVVVDIPVFCSYAPSSVLARDSRSMAALAWTSAPVERRGSGGLGIVCCVVLLFFLLSKCGQISSTKGIQ